MKERIRLLLLIAMLALISCGAFAASLSLNPNPATPTQGQNFIVSLNLDTAIQTRGYSIRFKYDTSVISYVSAVRGSLFNGLNVGWWRAFNGLPNEEPGYLRIECIIFGVGVNTTGAGNLLNITFNATNQGYTGIDLYNLKLYGTDAIPMANVIWNDGSVIIGSGASYASAMALLEGPFNGSTMNCMLQDKIPISSPLGSYPDTLRTIPADMVDWVLLELSASQGGSALYSQSAILHSNGSVTSPYKPYILIPGAPQGTYYLKLKHRNHLSLNSIVPLQFVSSGSVPIHDLRSSFIIDTNSGVKNISGNLWAMISGDANNDAQINPADRDIWLSEAGTSDYLAADFDLDGVVMPNDIVENWHLNAYPFFLPPTNPVSSSLHFSTANFSISEEGDQHILSFDLMLAAGSQGSSLGTGAFVLGYNPLVFGSNIAAAGNLAITAGSLLSPRIGDYTIISRDLSDSRLIVIYEFSGSIGVSVPLSASQLFRISIPIQGFDLPSGFTFEVPIMQTQQYQADYFSQFSPVTAAAINEIIPSAPVSLVITPAEDSIELSWAATPGYIYNVYGSSPLAPEWQLLASELETNSWIDYPAASIMYYRVTANSGRQ